MKHLRTSDLARAAAIHPNTVRLYEAWGLLPPVERSPKGYRRFTQAHLDQLLLIRIAMRFNWVGGEIRNRAYQVIEKGKTGDRGGALEAAYRLLAAVQAEQAQAESAADFLQKWAEGVPVQAMSQPRRIGDVARLLDTTIDRLRNWERNGLLTAPRDPRNGYRLYGAEEIGRLRVIRMLIQSRYSTMSILRMLTHLDAGETEGLRTTLDTPDPDEDMLYATDRWLTALSNLRASALEMIAYIEAWLQRQGTEHAPD